jgi:hypothetical protein
MKKYIIKSAKNNLALEELVNRAMEEGYIPLGGVQNDGAYFHQAMIFNHEENARDRKIPGNSPS